MDTEYDDCAGISQTNAERGAQVIQIDNGKSAAAIAVCAAIAGMSAAIAIYAAYVRRDDLIDVQEQYQKVRNHEIELEARVKVLSDDLQEMKHERR